MIHEIRLGSGTIGIEHGSFKEGSPDHGSTYLAFFPLKEGLQVGEQILDPDVSASKAGMSTWIMFPTVESLDVVISALDRIKKMMVDGRHK